MFETVDNSEVFLPGVIATSTCVQAWSYVTRFNFNRWFYVICRPLSEHFAPLIYLMEDIKQLLELQNDNGSIIDEAYLVLPSKLNISIHWRMDAVKCILIGYEPHVKHMQEVYIFELMNGERHVDSRFESKESDLLNISILCEFPITN